MEPLRSQQSTLTPNSQAGLSTSTSTAVNELYLERDRLRKDVAAALKQDDDPLDAYGRFVKWIAERDPLHDHSANADLIEVLEEATRTLKDDPIYKSDLRYLKLWVLYANIVEKPDDIYEFLIEKKIGTRFSQLYEEYALMLERHGRLKEAEAIYLKGINRPCRAVDRLRGKYSEFQNRITTAKTLQRSQFNIRLSAASHPKADALRRDPLKNFKPENAAIIPLPQVQSLTSKSSTGLDPSAFTVPAPIPGRRPEKLRFDISLLLKDGKAISFEEARAQSLGLLGKVWGPPPASEPGPHQKNMQMKVDISGRDAKNWTMSMVGEPTVTINTKEALKDVFGMFNSPDKSMRFGSAAGSKHAPVKKVEPPKFSHTRPSPTNDNLSDEGWESAMRSSTFRPYVDEVDHKENATPAVRTFKPFVDENEIETPVVTPGASRQALAVKENATPFSESQSLKRNGDGQTNSVFTRVFTPASLKDKPRKVLGETPELEERGGTRQLSDSIASQQPATSTPPLGDGNMPVKVFSRPTEQHQNGAVKVAPVFTSTHNTVDSHASLGPNQPLHRFLGPSTTESVEQQFEEQESNYDDSDGEEDCYDHFTEDESYVAPLGGRFGQFNVMTPIMERTFEFTMSTKAHGTSSDRSSIVDKGFTRLDAIEVAEHLAAELKEESEQEHGLMVHRKFELEMHTTLQSDTAGSHASSDEEPPLPSIKKSCPSPLHISSGHSAPPDRSRSSSPFVDDLADRTGTLSLADAIAVASTFRPPNPCDPSTPDIISTLLSLSPPDAEFHDLGNENAELLDGLQKFASKHARTTSENTTGGRMTPSPDYVLVHLRGRDFEVSDKLGEGGFGAVFLARARSLRSFSSGDEIKDYDEDDDNDDEDVEDANMVAIKVVKPRSVWEYHILRRIHRTLSARLRASVVVPHALYAYGDESFLVMDVCRQGTLLDIVNRAGTAGISQQGGCLDELLVMFFSIELLRFVEGMHTAGIIHGDIKIDNCLLRLEDTPGGAFTWSGMYQASGEGGWKYKGIKMIDFGRTIDTHMFPSGQQFIANWPADAGDCMEIRHNEPWTYQTDYYGLAGIIYCMLFGKHFDSSSIVPVSPSSGAPWRYKLSAQFKRYWQVDLWSRLFETLINPCLLRPGGSLPICEELGAQRIEMEMWLQNHCNRSSNSLKGLLRKVELSVLTGNR